MNSKLFALLLVTLSLLHAQQQQVVLEIDVAYVSNEQLGITTQDSYH